MLLAPLCLSAKPWLLACCPHRCLASSRSPRPLPPCGPVAREPSGRRIVYSLPRSCWQLGVLRGGGIATPALSVEAVLSAGGIVDAVEVACECWSFRSVWSSEERFFLGATVMRESVFGSGS